MRWMAAAGILVGLGAGAGPAAAQPAQVECAPRSAAVGERLVCDVLVDLRGEPAPTRRSDAEVVGVPRRPAPASGRTEIVAPLAEPTLGVWSGTAVLQAQAACAAPFPEVVAFPKTGAKPVRRAPPSVIEPSAPPCAGRG